VPVAFVFVAFTVNWSARVPEVHCNDSNPYNRHPHVQSEGQYFFLIPLSQVYHSLSHRPACPHSPFTTNLF
jgi:hypothetical protein